MSDQEPATVMLWAALPSAWARHANRLRGSAEVLWQPLERGLTREPPYDPSDLALWDHVYAFLLVAGAALEAMLKAAAMQAEVNKLGLSGVVTPENRLQRWILTHKQVNLAKRAGISLSESEEAQLSRFTKYSEPFSRFAIRRTHGCRDL